MSYPPPPPPPSYPYQGPGGPAGWSGGPAPDQRQATTALVLGILGIVVCSILAPFALVIGRNSLREIDASGGRLGGRGKAQAGYICGIIGTVLLAVGLVVVVIAVAVSTGSSSGA
ncbi:MAG: DUF4190 domain-containing protein [Nocardioidaceae bacterium]